MSKNNEIISKELLDILACPECKTDVVLIEYEDNNGKKHGLKCVKCHRIYPIKDGIPVMLIEEAMVKE